MRNVWYIARRDLAAYLRSPMGYIIMFASLALLGLLWNAFGVGSASQRSSDVLQNFFWYAGGTASAASVFISMRLIAEERQLGTMTLLMTSPVRDWQLVLGKFLSGVGLLVILLVLSAYMPALIYLNGKVSVAHVLSGYLGVLLIASSALALGVLSSALAPNQLVALVLGALMVGVFWLFWAISKIASPPVEDMLAYLSLFDKHFAQSFRRGIISTRDVVYYCSLIYVALLSATRVLESRRWQ
jgi:ABC-2 type transport system permease protein